LRGGSAKQGEIEHVGLAGVDLRGLRGGESGGNQVCLDGVGVDAVVDSRKIAMDVPTERFAFFVLDALELFYEVEFEFD
jgi:hypothetical protein